jgi:uncharacterized membrane protein YphA (DoxX/SURF4 family)
MFVATVVVACLLAAAFVMAGGAKLAGIPYMREAARHVGFSYPAYRVVGGLEVAAAAGLVIGLWLAPLGAAAAAGLVALMIGAVYFHTKAGDPVPMRVPAASLGLLALVEFILRLTSA